jgi:hypothetical protein
MIITAGAPRRPQRNRNILIALGVWLGLAIAFFAWFAVQNAGYRTQYATFVSSVRATVDAAPQQMKQAGETGDVAATVTALQSFSATLSQKISEAPHTPSVFGLRVGADAEANKQSGIVVAAKNASDTLKEAAEFIEYQSKLARSLQVLGLKDAGDYAHIIALADTWKMSIDDLQHATKPTVLTEVTATLLQKMIVVESRIRELAELYKQADASGFTAKQKELTSIIEEIKPLGMQVADISAAIDAKLQYSLADLRQKL